MAFLEYNPTEVLHQYCSVEAFFGIVRSKQLWLTDLSQANDPRELNLGFEEFIKAVKSVRHGEYAGYRGLFLSILAAKLSPFKENIRVYSACFSRAKDVLPMWAEYGSRHAGVCIGFRPTAIKDMPGRLQKVNYVSDDTPQAFRRRILEVAEDFDNQHAPDDLNYWIPATSAVFADITSLKHASWSHEREVRLNLIQTIQKPDEEDTQSSTVALLPDDTPLKWRDPLFRPLRGSQVAYLSIPFGRYRNGFWDPSAAIETVTLAPNCELEINDVARLMTDLGYKNFSIKRSECSIR